MVKDDELVAIFNSIHRVMKAEKLLKAKELPILLIPAPRSLSSDCGLAIRYPNSLRETVESALAANGLVPEEIHIRRGDAYEKLA
jgi:Protein of unknown function (DUF3343)